MGRVFEEAAAELDEILHRYASQPQTALHRLLLMALEREQIVSLAYRHAMIAARLQRMSIPDNIRRLIEHALVWVWKDEEMHTTYVRGILLQSSRGSVWIRTLAEQIAGVIAGWSTGVIQHGTWRSTPVAQIAARLVIVAGKVGGRVPAEVGRLLRSGPFRNFCLLNADLECASGLCWSRLLRLACDDLAFDSDALIEFQRVVEDEDRHRQVFEAVADSLTDDDRLAPGVTSELLTERIEEAGRSFLPRDLRGRDDADQPIGSGGRVWCLEGRPDEIEVDALDRILKDCDLADRINARAVALGKPIAALRVVIKGCFMLGYHRADLAPIVSPQMVERLALFFHRLGVTQVSLAEAQYVYDRFFHNRGVTDVARYFGFTSPLYEVADLTAQQRPHTYVRGFGSTAIGQAWAEADFRVTFAKLRSHPIEQVLLTVGNLEGIGGRSDEFLFVDRVADRPAALMALVDEYPPHYALLDGYSTASHGLAGMMGCRRPLAAGRFYAGADALAVDCIAARHVGVADPGESSLLWAACHWFGGWPQGVELIGTDAPIQGWRGPQSNDLWALLGLLAMPVYAWGSGRGSFFLPAMDQTAFPPRRPAARLVRMARRLMRSLLGLPSFGGG